MNINRHAFFAGSPSLAQGREWSKEDCDKLASQIATRSSGLERSLAHMNDGRSFLETSQADYVSSRMNPLIGAGDLVAYGADSLSVAGAVLMPWVSRTSTAGMLVSTASNVTNTGLATYHLGQGNHGYALMHGTAAVTDLMSVASNTVPVLKAVTVPVDYGKAAIGGTMIASDVWMRGRDRNREMQHLESHFDRMRTIESGIRNEISTKEALYDKHCR